jgi:hypothetical protein
MSIKLNNQFIVYQRVKSKNCGDRSGFDPMPTLTSLLIKLIFATSLQGRVKSPTGGKSTDI